MQKKEKQLGQINTKEMKYYYGMRFTLNKIIYVLTSDVTGDLDGCELKKTYTNEIEYL